MLTTAIVLFLIAAVGGLVMAVRIFGNNQPPAAIAVIHGVVAATALVIAIIVAIGANASSLVKGGVGVLVVAALGGFFLLSFHLRKVLHPKGVVVLHALLAVAGVACLIAAALGK